MAQSNNYQENADVTNPSFTQTQLRAYSFGPRREGLRLAHINVNGLREKLGKIKELLILHQLDILAITEARLTPKQNMGLLVEKLNEMVVSDEVIRIEGYRFERRDRDVMNQTGQGGGGIVIYVREKGVDYSLCNKYTEQNHVETPAQYIHILVTQPGPVRVVAVYLPPLHPQKADLRDEILRDRRHLENVVILGDFNIDLEQWRANSFGEGVFTQLIENYTRILTETRIDHIYTNNPNMILESGVVRCDISDHNLIYCTVKYQSPAIQGQPQQVPDETLPDAFTQLSINAAPDTSHIVTAANTPDPTESATKYDGKKAPKGKAGDGSVRPKDRSRKK